jgi:hypothetical protein
MVHQKFPVDPTSHEMPLFFDDEIKIADGLSTSISHS